MVVLIATRVRTFETHRLQYGLSLLPFPFQVTGSMSGVLESTSWVIPSTLRRLSGLLTTPGSGSLLAAAWPHWTLIATLSPDMSSLSDG